MLCTLSTPYIRYCLILRFLHSGSYTPTLHTTNLMAAVVAELSHAIKVDLPCILEVVNGLLLKITNAV